MRHHLLVLVVSTALTLGACGKKDSDTTAETNADTSMTAGNDAMTSDNMVMGNDTAVSPLTAQGFVNAAAASDRFEIESSKLAAASASSAAVKKFATEMIAAHTVSTAKLKSTIAGMTPAVTPDDTLTAAQQAKLDSLKGQKGAAFDTAYTAAQTEAHQMTLNMLKTYAASGDNDALKTFANGLVPTVTAHLNMAKGLK